MMMFFSFILNGCLNTSYTESSSHPDKAKAAYYNTELGLAYLAKGNLVRAKQKLLLAESFDPKSADVNAALAYFFEKVQDPDDAKKYYQQALRYAPDEGAQLNNYGAFLCRQGQYREAEQYFLRAVKDIHYLHTASAYENAALCAKISHDNVKATYYFKRALMHEPNRQTSKNGLMQMLNKQGHHQKTHA